MGFAGVLLLALAVAPIQGSQPPDAAEVFGFGSFSDDQLQTVNEISPRKAKPGDPQLPVEPPPVIHEAVPLDALPVTRAQPVSGSVSRPATARTADTGPIRIAVVSHLQDPALVSRAISTLAAQSDVQVYEADLATLDRPDVLLILGESGGGASVWYCGPSPNESSVLASKIVPLAGDLGEEPDDAIGTAVDDSLSCSTLHAGRARMAAVYVRLPAELPSEELALVVTDGVQNYLDSASSRIRRARSSIDVIWPSYGPITSHYGPDHALGIDIGQWEGDVVAATDGTVAFAGGDACCSSGLYVVIESPGGITTLYGHLEAIYVKEGDRVKAGQPLGPVGNTGHSSGIHLHFETIVDGVRVNPLNVLP
jgi:hypothetical protein